MFSLRSQLKNQRATTRRNTFMRGGIETSSQGERQQTTNLAPTDARGGETKWPRYTLLWVLARGEAQSPIEKMLRFTGCEEL